MVVVRVGILSVKKKKELLTVSDIRVIKANKEKRNRRGNSLGVIQHNTYEYPDASRAH